MMILSILMFQAVANATDTPQDIWAWVFGQSAALVVSLLFNYFQRKDLKTHIEAKDEFLKEYKLNALENIKIITQINMVLQRLPEGQQNVKEEISDLSLRLGDKIDNLKEIVQNKT